jgi:DNA-directed RNA polymerase specialized sigma24 family protein
MYNADTNDIDIEKLITEAIAGNKDASVDLVASEWMEGVLDKITTRHARKFKIDRNEIRDTVRDKLRENIETIGNPNRLPLTRCLASWVKKASRHLCINKVRHRKVEKNYADHVIHENTHGKRKSPKGIMIDLQQPAINSPEEILLKEEAASLWTSRMADLHLRVYDEIMMFSPKDIEIALLWAEGKTLKEIEQASGVCLSTAHRHLKQFQKKILESIGIDSIIADDPELMKGGHELLANCLRELNSLGYFPPCAA